MQTSNPKSKKQKFLIALPLFLVPIGILIYLLFTVFQSKNPGSGYTVKTDAFNFKLPSANLVQGEKNKLEAYMEAQKDSLKKEDARSQDPYAKRIYDPGVVSDGNIPSPDSPQTFAHNLGPKGKNNIDPNEQKVNDRLQKLYSALKGNPSDHKDIFSNQILPTDLSSNEPSTAKIQNLIAKLHEKDTSTDPKMDQLSTMLDKIMVIQHPELKNHLISPSLDPKKTSAYDVTTTAPPSEQLDWSANDQTELSQAPAIEFYDLVQPPDTTFRDNETILAVIHNNMIVHSGSTVQIRLLQDIYIGRTHIEKGNFLNGKCTIEGERVNIQITSLNYRNQIFPISLKVYDTDGMEGIPAPGAMSRDAAKEGLSQGVSGLGPTSFDPSPAGQATAASIETAKTLLSRKAKLVQAILKADHKILLKKA